MTQLTQTHFIPSQIFIKYQFLDYIRPEIINEISRPLIGYTRPLLGLCQYHCPTLGDEPELSETRAQRLYHQHDAPCDVIIRHVRHVSTSRVGCYRFVE